MDIRCLLNTLGVFSKCLMSIWKDYVSSQKQFLQKGVHHIKWKWVCNDIESTLMVVMRLKGSMPLKKSSHSLLLMWVSMKFLTRTLKCSTNVFKFLLMMFLKLTLRLHESPKVVWFNCFIFLGPQFLQHLNHHMVILLIHFDARCPSFFVVWFTLKNVKIGLRDSNFMFVTRYL
jgi:hypothetical protein